MDYHATVATLKEVARLAIFAGISAAIVYLSSVPNPDLFTVLLLIAFRAADKYAHKSENTDINGLLPF